MIFFDHIKGCSRDTTAYNTGLWTWIQFAKSSTNFQSPYPEIIVANGSDGINKTISGGTTKNYLLDPSAFSNARQWPAESDDKIRTLGHIITERGPAQTISKNLTLTRNYTFNVGILSFINSKVVLETTTTNDGLQAYSSSYNLTYFVLNGSGVTVKANTVFENPITCNNQITAVSFNATSDKRAKTNIKRLDQEQALEIVNKLPVYSFNYKKDNIPSIGVLAQEAAIYDGTIPNFSLVNNEQATGENGDYQTVKESKLVYILWAAIQEQSHQINQLKLQLKELQK